MMFLLDSCISFFAVKALRDAGFQVIWVPETGKDPGDEAIIEKAFQEKYVLVTSDKQFAKDQKGNSDLKKCTDNFRTPDLHIINKC